ncbi:OmpW family protein [Novosphingobium sp. B1]|uniref:OmpW/AlkL family protein n=1 Tax=Novosphingobium sp. B1 TaxID=1938756 RepID=UPI0009D7A52B|nr:OmpW family outer membrane protein [Novosphingobium sp. B1]SMC34923.1 outer membrane protein [Novosphingobium sp. B1]
MRHFAAALCAIAAVSAATPALAEPGDILIKIRGDYVLRSGSSAVTVDLGGIPVSANAKAAPGGEASLTFFITEHFATEFTLGGAPYDMKDRNGRTLVSAGLITPTAMLQYHVMPSSKVFRPYVGAGLSYANFYSEKPGEILTNRTVTPRISYSADLKGALAPVVQIGADIAINEQLYINVDAKYLGASSRLTVEQGGNSQTVSHKMRSLVLGAGVGFRF